jgi:hypothetical protein
MRPNGQFPTDVTSTVPTQVRNAPSSERPVPVPLHPPQPKPQPPPNK